MKTLRAYLDLTKPRILVMSLITTALGFCLSAKGSLEGSYFFATLLGAALCYGGGAALNHFLEHETDRKMKRTQNRPIPQGIITPEDTMLFGIALILTGLVILTQWVNLLTAFFTLLTIFLYVLVYTPMKSITWWNTTIGAIPGAMPPLVGAAAVSGHLDLKTWIMFLILFAWQHPHFYAIAWMYKKDYQNAGLQMLSVVDPEGKKIFHITYYSILMLLGISLLPFFFGITGVMFQIGAFLLGLPLLFSSMTLKKTGSFDDAKKLFKGTVYYLPVILSLFVVDGLF